MYLGFFFLLTDFCVYSRWWYQEVWQEINKLRTVFRTIEINHDLNTIYLSALYAVDLLAFRCETGVEYEMMGKTACYDIMPGSDNEGLFF